MVYQKRSEAVHVRRLSERTEHHRDPNARLGRYRAFPWDDTEGRSRGGLRN